MAYLNHFPHSHDLDTDRQRVDDEMSEFGTAGDPQRPLYRWSPEEIAEAKRSANVRADEIIARLKANPRTAWIVS